MALFLISYDVRLKNHDYKSLYDHLNGWKAAHLQNSIWLAELNASAETVLNSIRQHVHADDTVCVIELKSGVGWSTIHARASGNSWLSAHVTPARKAA
jgi:CRISPR/Cas system-associated endoribonuclease Cas2